MKKERHKPLVTLKVNKETQQRVKQHCKKQDYWMNRFVEMVLNEYIDKHEKQWEDLKQTIIEYNKNNNSNG